MAEMSEEQMIVSVTGRIVIGAVLFIAGCTGYCTSYDLALFRKDTAQIQADADVKRAGIAVGLCPTPNVGNSDWHWEKCK